MATTYTLEEAAALTLEQVELLTVPQLTAAHNAMAEACNVKPLKKFETKAQGIKRVSQLIEVASKLIAVRDAPLVEAPAAKQPKAKAKGERKASVSSRCCQLIAAGHTNDEVWAVVKVEFNLRDEKKHYPAWNRAMMARKGITGSPA